MSLDKRINETLESVEEAIEQLEAADIDSDEGEQLYQEAREQLTTLKTSIQERDGKVTVLDSDDNSG